MWIGLNGVQSAVYATEVSAAEYLTYTTEESEKTEVFALAEELGGDLELASSGWRKRSINNVPMR